MGERAKTAERVTTGKKRKKMKAGCLFREKGGAEKILSHVTKEKKVFVREDFITNRIASPGKSST
jgi:hypothetical protein